MMRRSHSILEVRNFICGHIKRNDAASRRFIQNVAMETSKVLILCRDVKTGRFLVTPREEDLWLIREKSGYGRAAKNDWNIMSKVGPQFFESIDNHRQWHLSFPDHYDVVIWDRDPGDSFTSLYNELQRVSMA